MLKIQIKERGMERWERERIKAGIRNEMLKGSNPIKTVVVETPQDSAIEETRASRQIVIFADTASQKIRIKEAAKQAGLSMSAFVLRGALKLAEADA
jgi:hypothetical protein